MTDKQVLDMLHPIKRKIEKKGYCSFIYFVDEKNYEVEYFSLTNKNNIPAILFEQEIIIPEKRKKIGMSAKELRAQYYRDYYQKNKERMAQQTADAYKRRNQIK